MELFIVGLIIGAIAVFPLVHWLNRIWIGEVNAKLLMGLAAAAEDRRRRKKEADTGTEQGVGGGGDE